MATETTRDNKAIEEKALLCFKSYIVDSKVISQFLDENDKEPCWDGHIYLYSDPVKDKAHLIGRVPVQVKGTEVSRFVLRKYKFTIEIDDLRAYLHEPTVFVVCQEKEGSKDRELFYRCLLPETVKHIIKGKEKQKTVNVLMHRIPEDLIDFENYMKVFYGDSKKQLSFADKKPFTMDDVQKRGINEFSFLAPTHRIDRMELMKYLSTHPSYIYAKVDKELDLEVPVSDGPMTFSFRQDVKKEVSVDGKVFFDNFINEIKEGKMVITIGNLLIITLPMDAKIDGKTEMKMESYSTLLKESIKEAELALAMNDSGSLTVGGLKIQVKVNEQNAVDKFRKFLPKWKALQNVLEKLHVTKDLELAGITKEQNTLVNILLDTVGEGKTVKLPKQETSLILMEISNVKLLLWCSADRDDMCMFGDFFDHQIKIRHQVSKTETAEASPFSYLRNDKLWEICDNIPYGEQISSYVELATKHNHVYEMANIDLLFMLSAYDTLETKDSSRSKLLLQASTELDEWLLANDPLEERRPIHKINRLQIVKRQRDLIDAEKIELKDYISDDTLNATMKAGVCLLLEDNEGFASWYQRCSDGDKELLESYPIWRFKN